MDRLTNSKENRNGQEPFAYWLKNNHPLDQLRAFEKLAEYEDAEERGLLLRLPCKIGDIVYALSFSRDEGRLFECVVKTVNICSEENYAVAHCEELGLGVTLFFDRFGKTVFLTKEEAEQALAEMKGE